MSKRLLLIWTGLFILLCLIGAWFYMSIKAPRIVNNETVSLEAPSSQQPLQSSNPVSNELKNEAPKTQSTIKPATSQTADKQLKPLNLELNNTPSSISPSSSIEGPVKPPSSSEGAATGEKDTLPLKGTGKKDKLLYGYEGKDKDDNVNLMLGVQKDDVTIKSGIKKGEDETEVQSIEIEVKLPK